MKYKLVCIDMDGTLLDDKHNVSEENKKALREATDLGVKIAITTGRLFASAKYYSDLIGIKAPIIASNGAYIREKDKEEVIYKSTLSKEDALIIADIVKKYDLRTCYNTYNTVIHDQELKSDHAYKIMNKNLLEENKVKFDLVDDFKALVDLDKYDNQLLKAICIEEVDKEKLQKAKEEFIKLDRFEVVSSWDNNFEIMKKETSKGNAAKELAKVLGIDKEQVICIGDSENDLSMIKYAGLGIAMGNALDLLKEEADYVTDTNLNSGVAKAINKFILNK